MAKKETWTTQINLASSMDDENIVELTKTGLKNHKDELKQLIESERPNIQNLLKEARAQGDLSENADYDASKEKQAEIETRISELEDIISRVKIIDTKNSNDNIVELGEYVTILMSSTKKEITVQVVGTIESDPMATPPKISSISPLGVAMVGSKLGSKVKVDVPKPYYAEIIKISKTI